jgi:hypothetical protein
MEAVANTVKNDDDESEIATLAREVEQKRIQYRNEMQLHGENPDMKKALEKSFTHSLKKLQSIAGAVGGWWLGIMSPTVSTRRATVIARRCLKMIEAKKDANRAKKELSDVLSLSFFHHFRDLYKIQKAPRERCRDAFFVVKIEFSEEEIAKVCTNYDDDVWFFEENDEETREKTQKNKFTYMAKQQKEFAKNPDYAFTIWFFLERPDGPTVLLLKNVWLSEASVKFKSLETLEMDSSLHLFAKRCSNCEAFVPTKTCSGCKSVRYCSIECQKEHWKEHKSSCVSNGANTSVIGSVRQSSHLVSNDVVSAHGGGALNEDV